MGDISCGECRYCEPIEWDYYCALQDPDGTYPPHAKIKNLDRVKKNCPILALACYELVAYWGGSD